MSFENLIALLKVFSNSVFKNPIERELLSDFFTWPNISGSPIIIESIPVITFNECLNASVPAYRYWSFFLRFSNLFKILETTFSKFFISDLEQTE